MFLYVVLLLTSYFIFIFKVCIVFIVLQGPFVNQFTNWKGYPVEIKREKYPSEKTCLKPTCLLSGCLYSRHNQLALTAKARRITSEVGPMYRL